MSELIKVFQDDTTIFSSTTDVADERVWAAAVVIASQQEPWNHPSDLHSIHADHQLECLLETAIVGGGQCVLALLKTFPSILDYLGNFGVTSHHFTSSEIYLKETAEDLCSAHLICLELQVRVFSPEVFPSVMGMESLIRAGSWGTVRCLSNKDLVFKSAKATAQGLRQAAADDLLNILEQDLLHVSILRKEHRSPPESWARALTVASALIDDVTTKSSITLDYNKVSSCLVSIPRDFIKNRDSRIQEIINELIPPSKLFERSLVSRCIFAASSVSEYKGKLEDLLRPVARLMLLHLANFHRLDSDLISSSVSFSLALMDLFINLTPSHYMESGFASIAQLVEDRAHCMCVEEISNFRRIWGLPEIVMNYVVDFKDDPLENKLYNPLKSTEEEHLRIIQAMLNDDLPVGSYGLGYLLIALRCGLQNFKDIQAIDETLSQIATDPSSMRPLFPELLKNIPYDISLPSMLKHLEDLRTVKASRPKNRAQKHAEVHSYGRRPMDLMAQAKTLELVEQQILEQERIDEDQLYHAEQAADVVEPPVQPPKINQSVRNRPAPKKQKKQYSSRKPKRSDDPSLTKHPFY